MTEQAEMEFTIRPLTRDDIESIARTFAPMNKKRAQYERYFEEQRRGERVTLVALAGGAVVGYTNLLWQPGYASFRQQGIPEISDLNVVKEYRRRGVATALIREAERIAAASGKTLIGIGVGMTPDYDAARSLYPKLGYVYDGTGVHADPPWDDAMYLTKKL